MNPAPFDKGKQNGQTSEFKIWYKDPMGVFLDAQKAVEILPEKGMCLTQQLNALMRFAVYLGVLLAVFHRSLMPALYIILVAGIFTAALDYHDKSQDEQQSNLMEKLDVKKNDFEEFCTVPTKTNPFMNVLPADYSDFPNKPEACDVTEQDVKDMMEANFGDKLFKDSDDIYGRNSTSRPFYTMPVSTIPNNQVEFAEWLYKSNDIDGVCRGGDAIACVENVTRRRSS